jgi:NAD(P)-dependent dehydrogenase (short-subunit alcohol dehydrogenase family)
LQDFVSALSVGPSIASFISQVRQLSTTPTTGYFWSFVAHLSSLRTEHALSTSRMLPLYSMLQVAVCGIACCILVPIVVSNIVFIVEFIQELILTLIFVPRLHVVPETLAVLITGCDTGIGLMAARHLKKHGYRVIAVCLTEKGSAMLKGELDLVLTNDITKNDHIVSIAKNVHKFCKESNASFWSVVHNAGIANPSHFDLSTTAMNERVMQVNVLGPMALTLELLPLLKRTKDSRIITMSSFASKMPCPGGSVYCASKHAIDGFMISLRGELKPWDIHVCNINPIYLKTGHVEASLDIISKAYNDADASLKSQYDEEVVSMYIRRLSKTQDDPMLAVSKIHSLLSESKPYFHNYVGRSIIHRVMIMLPWSIRNAAMSKLAKGIGPREGVKDKLRASKLE